MTLQLSSIQDLIQSSQFDELKRQLSYRSPSEIADLMTWVTEEDAFFIFDSLSSEISVHVFEFLPFNLQKQLIQHVTAAEASYLLKEMSPDDRTTFFEQLPREMVDDLVKLLPNEERILTLTLLGYPEGSVGRLMTPDYIAVESDWTIEEVLDYIQKYGSNSETIDFIYLINDKGKLLDDIKLKNILFVPRHCKIKEISDDKFISLSVYDNDEVALHVFRKHNRLALPVTDDDGILLGIVTIDDILHLSDEEATEDIHRLGGLEALDEPYMKTSFLNLMKKRSGWLVLLLLGETMTTVVLGYFEHIISEVVILAIFLPLIISSGGNAGSQASTLIIRAMALGEVKLKDWWQIVKRELLSGMFLGLILGVVGFLIVGVRVFLLGYHEHGALISLTVGVSLIGVVLWGTLSGAILPLILRRCGVDPATSSAPCVATIVDVTGLLIYFFVALAILRGSLL